MYVSQLKNCYSISLVLKYVPTIFQFGCNTISYYAPDARIRVVLYAIAVEMAH